MRLTRIIYLFVLVLLVGTFENRFALAGAVPSFTLSDLKGTWEGTWRRLDTKGRITVTFFSGGKTASYTVVDSDRARTKYRWTADITKNGNTIVSKPRLSLKRVETFNLSTENGWVLLKGSYTINGKPWGSINLRKKVAKK